MALWGLAIVTTFLGEGLVLVDHLSSPGKGYEYWLEPLLASGWFMAVGLLIHLRLPRHRVGDVFLAGSLASGLQIFLGAYAHLVLWGASGISLPLAAEAAWLSNLLQFGFVVSLLGLLYLFPDGTLAGRRWRLPAVALVAGAVLEVLTSAVRPGVLMIGMVANPFASSEAHRVLQVLSPLRTGLLTVGVVAALASPVFRYRRVDGLERLQLRWFAFGAVAGGTLLVVPVPGLLGVDHDQIGSVVWGVAPGLLPVAAGVAILRYRLYELGRLASRTLSYSVITALLLGLYSTLVFTLQRVLHPAVGASDLAVAGSTLAVAMVFRPLRRRVGLLVDRRFNRARYDGDRLLASFAVGVRDEVDTGLLVAELSRVIDRALQPAHRSVWLVCPNPVVEADGSARPLQRV